MITKVTITGADNSIKHDGLIEITKGYPFVEWGILLSRNQVGNLRFPSISWLRQLFDIHNEFQLAGHLCGLYAREILMGRMGVILDDLNIMWRMFGRIQINTHGQKHPYSATGLSEILERFSDKEFIFQYDEANTALIEEMMALGHKNISTLFDMSHGAGILPHSWPKPIPGIKCGFAGGLGPKNLREQIPVIQQVAGEAETWIDMETKVRSDNDKVFDIFKVIGSLEISKQLIPEFSNEVL